VRIWWSLVWPSVITNWSRVGMDLTDLSVLGHYAGSIYLSDVAYAQIMISLVMVFVIRGMAGSTVNVLCSTAYGARNFHLVGIYMQLSVLLCSLTALLLGVIWVWGGEILRLFVGRQNISQQDARNIDAFLRISLLWMVPLACSSVMSAFLLAQKVVRPQMCIMVSALLFNAGSNYVMVYGFGIGYLGSPLATVLSRWLVCTALACYISCSPVVRENGTWPGWHLRECLKGHRLAEFLKQAIPTAIGAAVEEFQIQMVAIFAGSVGPAAVATHNCTLSFFMALSCAMWGIQSATSARLGHHLGNGDLAAVRRVLQVAVTATLAWAAVVVLVFLVARHEIGSIYSSKVQVQQLAAEIATVVAGGYFVISVFYVIVAVLVATGQPKWFAIAFVIGGWGVALPLSYSLAFLVDEKLVAWWPDRLTWDTGPKGGLGLLGLWLGLAIGYMVTTAIAGTAAYRTDWQRVALEASARAEGSARPLTAGGASQSGTSRAQGEMLLTDHAGM